MDQKNHLHEEIDISRVCKNNQEIKHKLVLIKPGKDEALIVENLTDKVLELRFSNDFNSMFFMVRSGDRRIIPSNNKNQKLYIRLLDKA